MTEEEKAFRDKIDRVELEELMYDEFYELIAEAKKIGYDEAMRWRDPKIELPEYYKKVEIKIKRDDVVDYVNASLLAEDDGSLFFGDYNFVIFIKLKDVIGWRPIENKNHFEGRIEKAGCDFCRDEQGYTIGNMYVCDKCGRQVP